MARSKWDRMTPAQRQKRVQELIGNPNTRASIPTKYLPAAQRRQREENARLDRPVMEGDPTTNRELARERNASADLRYGPLEQQLNQQLQRSQGVQQAIPQWYEQYRQLIGAANQGAQAGYAAAQQQLQQVMQGTGQVPGQEAQAANSLNAEIQRLGGTPSPQNTQVAAQAAGVRSAATGNQLGVLISQGANANAYNQNLGANTGRHQIDALLRERLLENEVRGDQGQLARERGAYGVTQDQAIRDRIQKGILERQAFGLDVAQAEDQASDRRADNARDERRIRSQERQQQQSVNQYGYSNREWQRMSTQERQRVIRDFKRSGGSSGRGSGGAPRNEPAASLTPRRVINNRSETVRKYMRDNNLPVRNGTDRARLVAALRQTHGGYFATPDEEYLLRAAIDLATGGKIQRPTLRFLRRQGVYIKSDGSYWGSANTGSR